MLRKAVLLSCALFLILNVNIFSEQGVEESARDISQNLKTATVMRTTGIVIFSLGIMSCGVAGVFLMLGGLQTMDYSFSGDPEANKSSEQNLLLAEITGICGLVGVVVGSVCWIIGAHGIRKAKKSEIALQIRGPDLAGEQILGGISLVYSY